MSFNNKSLIYVVNCSDGHKWDSAKAYFDSALARLKQYSSSAKTVVLIHKIDLLHNTNAKIITVQYLRNFFQRDVESQIFFETSIYDNSLRDAFDEILSFSFPEMFVGSRHAERVELVSTDVESPQIKPVTTSRSPHISNSPEYKKFRRVPTKFLATQNP